MHFLFLPQAGRDAESKNLSSAALTQTIAIKPV